MRMTSKLLSPNPWREAATLMLAAPVKVNSNQTTVSYLMMTRSKKSKFMPGGKVFPGGAVSPIDYSWIWTELYQTAGVNIQNLNLFAPNVQQPIAYANSTTDGAPRLPQHVSLRITAIRETFEECGILLGKRVSTGEVVNNEQMGLQDKNEIRSWQDRVKSNPDEFFTLCKSLSVVPDLTSLVEWSNWITPSVVNRKQRFDTLFYAAIIPQPLTAVIDDFEAEDAMWLPAGELVDKHIAKEHRLMPPQFYELSRLRSISSIQDFQTLLDLRRKLGIETWLPALISTNEGMVSTLPGDELYPDDIRAYDDEGTPKNFDTSIGELAKTSKQRHRFQFFVNAGLEDVDCNISPRFGHYYSMPTSKV